MKKQKNILLLRGLVRESRHWGGFLSDLESRIPDANFITVDILGCGAYFREKTPVSISKIVRKLRNDYLDKIQELSEEDRGFPSYLFALSLGGMLAIEWINSYPDDFEKAMVVNTSLKGFSPFYKRLQPKNYLNLVSIARSKTMAEKEMKTLRMVSNSKGQAFMKTLDLWIDIQKRRPVSTANAARQIAAGLIFTPPNQRPKTPLLIVNSEGDGLVSPDCSRDIAKQWNVPLITHPTAGHDICADDPEWMADQIALYF